MDTAPSLRAEEDEKHVTSKKRQNQRQETNKEQAKHIIRAGQQTDWARGHNCSRQRQATAPGQHFLAGKCLL